MEAGKYRFRDDHLHILANYFGMDFQELKDLHTMGDIAKPAGYSDDKSRAVQLLERLLYEWKESY